MKVCIRCTEERPTEQFNKRTASKDGLHSWCKSCLKTYERDRYQNGDRERKEKNRLAVVERNRTKLWEVLSSSSCLSCSNTDPEVLEFDHRDPKDKSKNVSEMLWTNSWEMILKEIAKCDILCANCHRRKTNRQFGFWKTLR